MGLKRKLSFEESVSLSPPYSTPASTLPSSSQGSCAQPQAQYDAVATTESPVHTWNTAGAPTYFNLRTRKRFRDNRPPEEIIHERTLQKLYSAQKSRQQGFGCEDTRQDAIHSIYTDPVQQFQHHAHGEHISGPPVRVEITPERNQRSIDGFFSSSRPSSLKNATLQAPFAPSIYQPSKIVPTLLQPQPQTLPLVLTCEDCYAPLLTKQSGQGIDAEMLDVDVLPELVDPDIDEGWQCAVCAKRVCDTCAIRGDYRICLECAVPGGGKYEARELNQKRWVGGIGWT